MGSGFTIEFFRLGRIFTLLATCIGILPELIAKTRTSLIISIHAQIRLA